MSVCAIVLNYRGAQETRICLESLLCQEIDSVFVVDNSELDEEYKSLQRTISDIQSRTSHPMIFMERMNENLGFANSINYAVNRIQSLNRSFRYYLLINNDASILPGVMHELIAFMDESDDILAVTPTISCEDKFTGILWYNRLTGATTKSKKLFSFPYISGCCMLVRTGDMLGEKNIFDDSFFMYGEDVYFCWRAKQKGRRVVCLENLFVSHREMGSSSGAGCIFVEYHLARARLLLAIKARRSVLEIPLQVAGHALYLFARAGFRTFRYGRIEPLIAFFLMWLPLGIRPKSQHS